MAKKTKKRATKQLVTAEDILTKARMDSILVKLSNSVESSLDRRIGDEADKIARRWVKDNKKVIEEVAKKELKESLTDTVQRMAMDALENCSISLTEY